MFLMRSSLKLGWGRLLWSKSNSSPQCTTVFSSLQNLPQSMLAKMAFVALEECHREAFLDILPHLDHCVEGRSYFVSKHGGGVVSLQDNDHSLYDVLMVHLQIERKKRIEDVGGSLYALKHQKTPLGVFEALWLALFKSQCKPTAKDLRLFVQDRDVWELYLRFYQQEGNINAAMANTVLAKPKMDPAGFSSRVASWISYGGDIDWRDTQTQAGMGHLCFLNYHGSDIAQSIYMLKGFLDHKLTHVGPTLACKSIYSLIQDAIEKTAGVKFINLPTLCQQTIFILEAIEQNNLLTASLQDCLENKPKDKKPSKKM